ncbi:MAG: DUF364 domain-containing protein [Pseudomonadota bacterium]
MTKTLHIQSQPVGRDESSREYLKALQDIGFFVSSDSKGNIQLAVSGDDPPAATLKVAEDISVEDACPAVPADAFSILKALGFMKLEQELCDSVPQGHIVDQVIVGFNWTMVRAGELCGIARSPDRGTEGARTIRPPEGFVGKDLSTLAKYLLSTDSLHRSLGLACVNCYWNRVEPPDDAAAFEAPRGGLASIDPPGEDAIIIGGFRGALRRLPKARIVERDPKPGDIPASEAPKAYRSAKTLAITAQTLMNGSLTPILLASHMVRYRILVGPSCPASPIFFDHGIDEVFGAIVLDPDAAERFILESGTMIMLDHIATTRTLRASR